ncbi:hypothetical protein RSAG8_13363, partial [Rhizoctonia solani AG-8 WAC10335]
MPTAPLGHTPLLFLDDATMPLDRGPFGIKPFINNHFRLLCGLMPVQDAEDIKTSVVDIHGENENDQQVQYSSLSDGFLLSDEGRASLKLKDRKFFTDSARLSHSEYLLQALKYTSQHREAIANSTGSGKGKGKRNARKTEGNNDEYHPGAVLAMYNRPNGVMTRIADLMKRTSRSPVHVWRDSAFEEPEDDPYSLTVKSSKGILHELVTQASLELFGTTALTPSTRVPRSAYKPFVQAVLDRVWERQSRQLNRTLGTAVETREKCKNALEDATIEPTQVNLREASHAMKKYKDLDVWAALGYVRNENGSMRRIKATKKAVSMTEDSMDRAYAAYVELHFPPQQEAIEEVTERLAMTMNSEDEVNVDLLDGTQGSDIGVAEYANKSLDEMFRLFGLTTTRRIPFTSDELKVQWHQMVAIAVQIKAMFTKKLGEHAQPRLLCDEVGLGKTAESIGAEAGETLSRAPTGAAGRESRFRGEPPAISTNNAPDHTVFSQEFLFFACDELHQLRNATSCQDGVTKLSCNSLARTGATASPVFTGAKDATSAAVILRIPEMIGDEGYALGHELLESQKSQLKEWKARQSNLEDTQNEQAHDIANTLLKGSDPRGYKAFFIQQPSIEIIRKILTPYIIRRTSKSRTPDGSLILNIPDYVKSTVWVSLKEVEKGALSELYNRLMSEKPNGLQGEMLLSWNTLAPLEHFWERWTLENLQQMASSKLLITLDILEHYKEPSAQPLFFKRDGTRDLEQEANFVPPPSPQIPDKPRKILIFIMYDRHTQVTKFVLDLRGYKYLEYNGSKSDVERNRAVKEFETRDDIHVLLLSNVGTTGLNLMMASVVIFLSGLWSGQEEKQTVGRCVRPGQLFVAHIYHILAPNTADEILSGYATSKTVMEDELFVQRKQLATKIFHREDESDSEDSDTEAPSTRANHSTVVARALKGQKQTVGSTKPAPPTNEQAKPRKRKIPALSKSGRDPTGQGAGGSKPKRQKVLEQGNSDDPAQPQPSSLETNSTQVLINQDEVAPASSKPRARPKMHVRPGAQECGTVTRHTPPPGPKPTAGGATRSTSSIPVASALSPPPPPPPVLASTPAASLIHPSKLADHSMADSALDVVPDDSSVLAPAAPKDLTGPSGSLDTTSADTHHQAASSSAATSVIELPSDDDPDVDVVGYEEERNLPDDEHHTDSYTVQPTPDVASSTPSKVTSARSKARNAEGPETDICSTTSGLSLPAEDALMQSIFKDMNSNQHRNPIVPGQPDRPKAHAEKAARVPNTPVPTAQAAAKDVRNTSGTSRQRIDASHISSQPSQQSSGDQSQNRHPKPITMSGGFRDVSKADVPKILAQNRRAVMEQIDRAAQTGVAKPSSSKRASSALPLDSSSRQSIQPQDVFSSSKGNAYRSFQLRPTDPRAQ